MNPPRASDRLGQALTTKQLAINACSEQPEPLRSIYDFVHSWKPEVPEHSVRARLHEAVKEGTIVRVEEGVYFARSGEAQILLVEGNAWDIMKKLDDDSLDLLLSDVPGKFGREWAGTGTTRPHRLLGGKDIPPARAGRRLLQRSIQNPQEEQAMEHPQPRAEEERRLAEGRRGLHHQGPAREQDYQAEHPVYDRLGGVSRIRLLRRDTRRSRRVRDGLRRGPGSGGEVAGLPRRGAERGPTGPGRDERDRCEEGQESCQAGVREARGREGSSRIPPDYQGLQQGRATS